MARKHKMPPKTTSWIVKSVESNWHSGATVTLAEVFYTKWDADRQTTVAATAEDHDDWTFDGQEVILQMAADEAPAAGAHIRLTLEQVA